MWPVKSDSPLDDESGFPGAGNASSSRPLSRFAPGFIPERLELGLRLTRSRPCSVKEQVPFQERHDLNTGAKTGQPGNYINH